MRRGQRAGADAVTASALGAVEGFVSLVDEQLGWNAKGERHGYAETAGDVERAGSGEDGRVGDDGAELFGALEAVPESEQPGRTMTNSSPP